MTATSPSSSRNVVARLAMNQKSPHESSQSSSAKAMHLHVEIPPALIFDSKGFEAKVREHLGSLSTLVVRQGHLFLDENWSTDFPAPRATLFGPDEVAVQEGHFERTGALQFHFYSLSQEEATTEELDPSGGEGDEEWTAACDSLPLPHASFNGLWNSLWFPPSVKRQLMRYAESTLLFSDKGISSNIVHWNRIILLYGPPGTGKTSLCKALAQHLSIRLRFPRTTLLEIHSHSLFSKWFSTSGKLVNALFQMVREMVQDDPDTLVCVLVDEVESLAASRSASTARNDPVDALRAVNALLTSVDKLQAFPNVLVLATTNVPDVLDAAWLDRVDCRIRIGYPEDPARLGILQSCLEELQRAGIVQSEDHKQAQDLWTRCVQASEGLSGRSLRRLPLQAHAKYGGGTDIRLVDFLAALKEAIDEEQANVVRAA